MRVHTCICCRGGKLLHWRPEVRVKILAGGEGSLAVLLGGPYLAPLVVELDPFILKTLVLPSL